MYREIDTMRWYAHIHKSAGAHGEWWIDASGDAQSADGDVGDYNHAMVAFEAALGISLEWADEGQPPMEPFVPLSQEAIVWLRENGTDEKNIAFLQSGRDPREWALETQNWIRVKGDNAEVWTFDQNALDRLANLMCSEDGNENPTYVYEYSTGETWEIEYDTLCGSAPNINVVKGLEQITVPPPAPVPGPSNPYYKRWGD